MKFRVALSVTALCMALTACQKEGEQPAEVLIPADNIQGAGMSVPEVASSPVLSTETRADGAEQQGLFSRIFKRDPPAAREPVVIAAPAAIDGSPVIAAEIIQPVVVEPVIKQSRRSAAADQQPGATGGLVSRITSGRWGGGDPSGDASAACPTNDALNQQMFDRINTVRAEQRKTPLKGNNILARIAQAHICDISATGRASVAGSDGRNVVDRARDAGYPTCGVSQLISVGGSPNAVVASWMASIPHRTELLQQQGEALGVGTMRDAQGRIWWSVVIGSC